MSKQAEYLKKRGWLEVQRKKIGCTIQVWWMHPEKSTRAVVPQGWAMAHEQTTRRAQSDRKKEPRKP